MNSIARRISSAILSALAAAALGAAFAAPGSAVEPRPRPAPVNVSAWAEPQPALDGLPLAVYVSLHIERIIGPVGV